MTRLDDSRHKVMMIPTLKYGSPGINYYTLNTEERNSTTGIRYLRCTYLAHTLQRDFFSFGNSLSLKAPLQSLLSNIPSAMQHRLDDQARNKMMSMIIMTL